MARVDVLMPQMGESIAEGTLSKWLKKLGDEVKRDEPLFEISTDKVDAEIPAPSAGVLAEIKVQEGQTVPVQTLVAVIETDKSAATTAAPSAAAQRAPAASGAAVASSPPAPKPAPAAPAAVSPPSPTAPSRPLPPTPAPAVKGGDGAETAEERLRRKSTPLVRKIAAEHQVDISTIPGTGFAGRVTKQDILGFIETGVKAPGAAPVPRAPSPVPSTGPVVHPVVEPWPGDRVEPFSKIRKITADHMIMSRRTSAITNPGVFGSYAGAPIINQPQVAILGVGAIEKRPKVVSLSDGTDTIAIRTMGMLSMSYDHRIVDGADADRFLADLKQTVENFPEGAI